MPIEIGARLGADRHRQDVRRQQSALRPPQLVQGAVQLLAQGRLDLVGGQRFVVRERLVVEVLVVQRGQEDVELVLVRRRPRALPHARRRAQQRPQILGNGAARRGQRRRIGVGLARLRSASGTRGSRRTRATARARWPGSRAGAAPRAPGRRRRLGRNRRRESRARGTRRSARGTARRPACRAPGPRARRFAAGHGTRAGGGAMPAGAGGGGAGAGVPSSLGRSNASSAAINSSASSASMSVALPMNWPTNPPSSPSTVWSALGSVPSRMARLRRSFSSSVGGGNERRQPSCPDFKNRTVAPRGSTSAPSFRSHPSDRSSFCASRSGVLSSRPPSRKRGRCTWGISLSSRASQTVSGTGTGAKASGNAADARSNVARSSGFTTTSPGLRGRRDAQGRVDAGGERAAVLPGQPVGREARRGVRSPDVEAEKELLRLPRQRHAGRGAVLHGVGIVDVDLPRVEAGRGHAEDAVARLRGPAARVRQQRQRVVHRAIERAVIEQGVVHRRLLAQLAQADLDPRVVERALLRHVAERAASGDRAQEAVDGARRRAGHDAKAPDVGAVPPAVPQLLVEPPQDEGRVVEEARLVRAEADAAADHQRLVRRQHRAQLLDQRRLLRGQLPPLAARLLDRRHVVAALRRVHALQTATRTATPSASTTPPAPPRKTAVAVALPARPSGSAPDPAAAERCRAPGPSRVPRPDAPSHQRAARERRKRKARTW